MRIEKISENQIKCTLNRSDLASRQIKISELAYGTEKTKGLFHDMMEQAETEFGFEVNDSPLMIEAIPVSMDSIVLMITKVDDPDEIDSKFAGLTRIGEASTAVESNDSDDDLSYLLDDRSFKEILEAETAKHMPTFSRNSKPKTLSVIEKLFSFDSLDSVINFSHHVNARYNGRNSLYKCKEDSRYFLHLEKSDHPIKDFVSVCDLALEYGKREQISYGRMAFIEEHFMPIIKDNATQSLAQI